MTSPVALVTGAGRGIGRAIAVRLDADGFRVAVADKDAEAARQVTDRLDAGRGAAALTVDVAEEPEVRATVAAVVERFGRLDALVNNAGIMVERPPAELALEDWRRVLDTNLTGAFLCAREAAPHLARDGGAIVNIASTRAHMSEPGSEAYAASKGGLVALTHALAVSLGPAVRVNCVSPGWIETGDHAALGAEEHAQHPAGRVGTPEDVAGVVAFLLSDQAGFVTGAEWILDGGMTRRMIYV